MNEKKEELYPKTSNLIKEYVVPAPTSSFNIDGLNLLKDGGIYEIIIIGNNSSQNGAYLYCNFNSISTQNYYSKFIQYSTSVVVANSNNETSAKIAVLEGNNRISSTSKSTITLEQYTITENRSIGLNSEFNYNRDNSLNSIYEKIITSFYNFTIFNLTSLFFTTGSENIKINKGTTIRIYKK